MAKINKKAIEDAFGGIGGDIPLGKTPEETAKAIADNLKSSGVNPDMNAIRQVARDAHKRK
ncbi:hypothetical protein [Corynebacterium provencense]|uniref:hypothetical protein n=1 Tax=Corynebacterium provencense TaxID=1737425 RepID=UPI0008299068|nr:hypothetical protein [Corynebacterium provencense]